jgi:hypothetical protein
MDKTDGGGGKASEEIIDATLLTAECAPIFAEI